MSILDILLLIGVVFGLAKGVTDITHQRVETFAGLTKYRTILRGCMAVVFGIIQIFTAVGIAINVLFVPDEQQFFGHIFSIVPILVSYMIGFFLCLTLSFIVRD